MPKKIVTKNNFTSGELSPLLDARADLSKYANGAKSLENFVVLPHGGITRRPGSKHIAATKTGTKTTRLIPFIFGSTQAYVLEFGDLYMRVFKDKGQVNLGGEEITNGTFDSNITGWSDASSGGSISWDSSGRRLQLDSTPSPGTAVARQTLTGITDNDTYALLVTFITGDKAVFGTIKIGTTLGGSEIYSTVARGLVSTTFVATATTIYIEVLSNGYTIPVYVDDISVTNISTSGLYELVTPYPEADLFELQFTQSADVLYIVHPSYAPRELTRSDHNSWTINDLSDNSSGNFFKGGDWVERDVDAVTMTLSDKTGNGITCTASAATFTSAAVDVGKAIEVIEGTTTGLAVIVGFTSTTVVTVDILTDFGATTASKYWRLTGLFADTSDKYPSTVALYENRLFFGGSNGEPQAIWGSRSGDYLNMVLGISDADAVKYIIGTDQVNVIKWFSPGEFLLIGTAGGEFSLAASSLGEAVTPTNIKIARQSGYGSDAIMPLQLASATIYVQRTGRKIRELAYNFQNNKHISTDMMLLAEHLTDRTKTIIQMGFQLEPYGIIWCVRSDGTLLGLTYMPQQEVIAWHTHILGGTSDVAGTQAQVESVAVIPSSVGGSDEVWICVKRYIDGAEVRHVELLEEIAIHTVEMEDSMFMDDALRYDGAAATVISGLDHLEGETVDIITDGFVHNQKVVSSGSITLDISATQVSVGLNKTATAETMRAESVSGGFQGSEQGEIMRIIRAVFRLYRSGGLDVGPTTDDLETMNDLNIGDLMDNPTPLFTGDRDVNIKGGFESENRLVIQQPRALPATILGIFYHQRSKD